MYYRHYSNQEIASTIEMIVGDLTPMKEAAAKNGIGYQTVCNWMKQHFFYKFMNENRVVIRLESKV